MASEVVETLPPLHTLPLRIRRMITIVLEHQQLLCQADVGSLELHFHREPGKDAIKPKLVLHLAQCLKD